MPEGGLKMFAGITTAGIGMFEIVFGKGENGFLSLIMALIMVSCIAIPDKASDINNKEGIDCTGLVAANYLQLA